MSRLPRPRPRPTAPGPWSRRLRDAALVLGGSAGLWMGLGEALGGSPPVLATLAIALGLGLIWIGPAALIRCALAALGALALANLGFRGVVQLGLAGSDSPAALATLVWFPIWLLVDPVLLRPVRAAQRLCFDGLAGLLVLSVATASYSAYGPLLSALPALIGLAAKSLILAAISDQGRRGFTEN